VHLCAVAPLADSRSAPLLAAACLRSESYSLLIIYARCDFAELLAIAMFPILLLATLRLTGFFNDQEHCSAHNILGFAMWFCAIWLSNAPAAVIATYSVGFLLVFAALRQRSIEPLKTGGAGMGLGFGLSSFYLIPAIYEQRWVNISGILSAGLRPAENFLYARTSDAEHDAFNRMASNIAVLLIFWTVSAALAAWRMERATSPDNRPRFFLPAFAAGDDRHAVHASGDEYLLGSFTRDALFAVSVAMDVHCCLVRGDVYGRKRPWNVAMGMAADRGGGDSGLRALHLAKHSWWDSDDMPTLQAAMAEGSGFEGTDEYDPAGDDRTDLPQKAPRAAVLANPSSHES